ncbi:MAG: hypothetical protein R3F24_12910 [Gammaproteobacteria bacterium]
MTEYRRITTYWRTVILLVASLGAAWAVTQVGDGPPGIAPQATDTDQPAPDQSESDQPESGQAESPELDQAAVEEQIRRAETALGERADPDRELPVEPLRADVAIALPSDI